MNLMNYFYLISPRNDSYTSNQILKFRKKLIAKEVTCYETSFIGQTL